MNPYTDNPELDALVRERMETLPAGLRRLFDDPASAIYIENFAATVGLTEDQTQQLQHEIMLLMLGFTPRDDFSFVLMTELDMPPRQAFAVEHWVTTVFLKDVVDLLGTTVPGGVTVDVSEARTQLPNIPEAPPLSGALIPQAGYVAAPVAATPETMVRPLEPAYVPAAPAPVPQAVQYVPVQPAAYVPVSQPVAAYVPPPQSIPVEPVHMAPPAPVAIPMVQVPVSMPVSTIPVAATVAQSAPAPQPVYAPPIAQAPVSVPAQQIQLPVVQSAVQQPVPSVPLPVQVPQPPHQEVPIAVPVPPVPTPPVPPAPKPVPPPVQPVSVPPAATVGTPVRLTPPSVPMQAVTPIPPPLPTVATPIAAPAQMLTPPVPRIASGAPIDLNKPLPKPRTIFQDIAAARGAISPEGVARYDKPFAQAPAYGVPNAA